jgi:hypothetical protein
MNYWRLRIEGGADFSAFAEISASNVGARSDLIPAIRLRQTKVPRAKSNATDFEQAGIER